LDWKGLTDPPVSPPCPGQGPLPPAQAAPSPIQPGLEPCQGGGSHSFSGHVAGQSWTKFCFAELKAKIPRHHLQTVGFEHKKSAEFYCLLFHIINVPSSFLFITSIITKTKSQIKQYASTYSFKDLLEDVSLSYPL